MRKVETPDGRRLALQGFPSPPRPRGVLWIGHAMMANRGSLDRPRGSGLASVLARSGFQVYTADLRGHGESAPGPADGASYDYADLALTDVPSITEAVSAAHPDLPLGIIGHSLTAHAALAWLGQAPAHERRRVRAVVSIAGNVWLRGWERSALRWATKRASLAAWVRMARRRGYFDARRRHLGSDDVALPYIEDFLRWARTGRWTTASGIDLRAGLGTMPAPVLAIAGRGDRLLCTPASSRAFAAELRAAAVTHWTVGRASGLAFDPGHMALVTDPRSAPLWDDIATWLDATLPRA